MLDFGALPPEINSARMYAGPGAGPMLAAAAAWQELAGELHTGATSYGAVVASLTSGSWAGPAALSMAAAAAPYATWLHATAAQAEQTAGQTNAAAAAYETAFAATVPPPLIAANRSLLASLTATNFLGQNTAAIAATEVHYAEMWAQDAAAMYGYAAGSAAATRLTPFTSPPQTTDPAGQAAAVAQAAGTSAGTHAETLMSAGPQLISATPQALQGLASPAGVEGLAAAGSSGASSDSGLSSLSSLSMLTMPLRMLTMPLMMLSRLFMMGGMGGANGLSSAAAATTGVGTALSGGLSSAAGAAAPASVISIVGGGQAATAGLGQATSVGALSVPPAWAGFGSQAGPATAVLASTSTSTAPVAGMGQAAMPPMMPITNMAARGAVGPASQYDFRPNLIPRSPAGG